MASLKEAVISLQLWSLNQECAKDFFGTLRQVSEMGYEGVEFAGFHGKGAAEVRKTVEGLNLKMTGTHLHRDQLEGDKFAETVAFYKELGVSTLIVPWAVGPKGTAAQWQEMAQWLTATADKLAQEGMRLGYHNHEFEFAPVDGGKLPFDIVFGNTPASVVMQIDMGWSEFSRQDTPALFARYPGRSLTTHVKAHSAANRVARIGEDDVDWKKNLEAAAGVGGCRYFVVEHEEHGDTPPLENVKVCLECLKRLRG
ncbi:MAG: sugar phosphate isomerase/epimerase [Planctomycetes bacterium]|nr:sugar phosphate isomerase/epimerase [Planctomycetota bacterium]